MEQMKALHTLELPKILQRLAAQAACAATKERIQTISLAQELYTMRRQLEETTDAKRLIGFFGSPSILDVKDVAPMMARAEKGGALSMKELLSVAALLRCTSGLKEYKGDGSKAGVTILDSLFTALTPNRSLEGQISAAILSEEEMADSASSELAAIRRQMRNAESKIRDILQKYIKSAAHQKHLQEPIITMRSDRYVIPVKSEARSEVPGLVHDSSASGATLFVEPMAVVEANNEIKMLAGKEQQEIERILLEFTEEVFAWQEALLANYRLILELDFAFAKAKLSIEMRGNPPTLNDRGYLHLISARHPLIDPRAVVPTTIELGGAFDTLVITGPNTGGKTVALKTIGLFVLMAQAGLHLPAAEGSEVSLFGTILADIGDEQSIEQSLSTFSSHMTNIVQIVKQTDSHSLVLLDELGAGTDPVEGAALAIAILEQLRMAGARIAATTHYSELKLYALETAGVENGSCEFDVETLRPTYRLLIGIPGKSNAFAISRRLGLSEEVVGRAEKLVSEDSARFEDVLYDMEKKRQETERALEASRKLRAEAMALEGQAKKAAEDADTQKDKELEKAREQGRTIVERARFVVNQLVDELETIRKEKDQADFSKKAQEARKGAFSLLDKLDDEVAPVLKVPTEEYINQRPLKKGDSVEIRGIGTKATVLEEPDKRGMVLVQAGIIKTRIAKNGLKVLEDQREKKDTGRYFSGGGVARQARQVQTNIDVRGQNAEEALLNIDKFLDDASLLGLNELCIVHGKGTGVLRASVQQFLRSNTHVKTFRLGRYGEGEDGVTLVELR